jgi:hypothetical protein
MRHKVINTTIVIVYPLYFLSEIDPISNINSQIATMRYPYYDIFCLAQREFIHISRTWIALQPIMIGVATPIKHNFQSSNFSRKYNGYYPTGFT